MGSEMCIRDRFRDVTGILAGTPRHVVSNALDEVANLFDGT